MGAKSSHKQRKLPYAIQVTGETRNAYRISVSLLEGKKPFGRPRSRWKDNVKILV
jgi:hypothetical protein